MQPVLNVEDIKRVEVSLTRVGVSVSELMHRAGYAAAQEVLNLGGSIDNVVILAGMGNNGGDGWVAAEALRSRNVNVKVITPIEPDQISGDLARQMAQRAVRSGVSVLVGPPKTELADLLSTTDAVLDCMLGTGFHGKVRAPFDIWIETLNESGARVLAVDVPSGLDSQTGHAEGACVIADMTVTMIALKPGLLADAGRDVCGSIVVAPLAEQTERLVVDADPVAWRTDLEDYLTNIPAQLNDVDKFSRGSVLVVGGSSRFPGAVVMAARSAARAGAGYVTLAVPEAIVPIVQIQCPEIPVVGLPCDAEGVLTEDAVSSVAELAGMRTVTLVGPGMRVSGGTVAVMSSLIDSGLPLVVDADALNCIARLTNNNLPDFPEVTRRSAPLILTPHRRELGRLVGMLDTPPASLVEQLDASRKIIWADGGSELVIVAKSTATACVGVQKAVLPKPGPATLATAGSGDVLSGIIAGRLALAGGASDDLPVFCALACEVHAYAGQLAAEKFGTRGVLASDISDAIGLAADTIEEQIAFPVDTMAE
ncbi:carbohydrate kinase, YjeF related protein [Lancefieldella rimae]|uniref:Bifunctional NAD(P)H-hydrate repair enzyme n=2 Tax=Lancefieldella rimae TaxID=1383 RepID=B9CMF7_LANR4|nr:bifunctional ADP-dependent NAD(P)H-hydrate dehydratase/NAD(P)H-hydrate epimerase [Lancefieldella rimae]EEE17618.1 YjeF-like protein [Lancefieldella rimae ATCC 49626]KRO02451.1 carbohydrate kinase, YjeF related protein [Lancefieldella rimae]